MACSQAGHADHRIPGDQAGQIRKIDFPVDQIQQVCKSDGGPLLVRYDLRRVRDSVTKDALRDRPQTIWRYRELLPYEDAANAVTLGELNTPLLETPSLGAELGIPKLRVPRGA